MYVVKANRIVLGKKAAEETAAADSLPSLGDAVVDVPLEREIIANSDSQVSIRVVTRHDYVII
jgi:hypothetical protein